MAMPKGEEKTVCASYIGDIQQVGKKAGIPIGEQLRMILITYGWLWADIPAGRAEEVKTFLRNNAHQKLKIIDPEFAERLENYNPTDEEIVKNIGSFCPDLIHQIRAGLKHRQPRTEY